jgi:TolB-like protein
LAWNGLYQPGDSMDNHRKIVNAGARQSSGVQRQATRIAVLPFRCLTPESEPEGLTRGLHEDLATELSRYPTLEVVAPDSASALVEPALRQALLHTGCIVRGSLRSNATSVRLNVQLTDSAQGRSLWAERYDFKLSELFIVEDEIVHGIANALHARVEADRLLRARNREISNLEAYDCWLRGFELLRRGTLEDDLEARTFFHRAIELDPAWARGYAGMSLSFFNEWSCQAWHLFAENEQGAFEYARRAAELDDTDALVHIVLARVHLYRRRFLEAEKHFNRGLALNPNHALILANAASGKSLLGDHEEAVELASKAMRLHPLHDDSYFPSLAIPLFHLGRLDEANECLAKAGTVFVDTPAYRAAIAAVCGNEHDARRLQQEFVDGFKLKITFGREPDRGELGQWLLMVNPYRREQDIERFSNALAAAGLDGGRTEPRFHAARPANLRVSGNVFRREGRIWSIAFCGTGARLPELKGFHDIAYLIARPGIPVHCLELLGAPLEPNLPPMLVDEKARAACHERIRELQNELEQAESRNDRGRAEQARCELDQLVEELSKAMGLAGRSRKLQDPAEKARSAVTWRIRSAIKSIQAAHPRLGSHFANSVRTGTFCTYSPEDDLSWQL